MSNVDIIIDTLKVNYVLWYYLEWRTDIVWTYTYLSCFKAEKTPSLVWTDDKNIWKDFSSGKWGNVIQFVMEFLGLSFLEAIEELNTTFGLWLDIGYNSEEEKKKRRIYDFHKTVVREMSRRLFHKENIWYLNFLVNERWLSKETIKRFQIGLSLDRDMEDYIREIQRSHFTDLDIKETSFYHWTKGHFLFENRIMFPIINKSWKIVAFSGMRLNIEQIPKYINSSDTLVYHKWANIFNLNYVTRGKEILENEIYICEGNVDSVQLYNYGSQYATSLLWTGFTNYQKRLLHEFDKVTLIFDNDEAGTQATRKYAKDLYAIGKTVFIFSVPKEYNGKKIKDIDEYLKVRPELMWEIDKHIIEKRREYLTEILIPQYSQYKDYMDIENSTKLLEEIKRNFLAIGRRFDTKIQAYKNKLIAADIHFNQMNDPLEEFRRAGYPELSEEDMLDLTVRELREYNEEREKYIDMGLNKELSDEDMDSSTELTETERAELSEIDRQTAMNYIYKKYPQLDKAISAGKFWPILKATQPNTDEVPEKIRGIDKLIQNKEFGEIYSKLKK